MLKVVSNSTPIIALIRIGELNLLEKIFKKIVIPKSVNEEITVKDKIGYSELENKKWIQVLDVKDILAVDLLRENLDKGESEAIILAKEIDAEILLIDEKAARKHLKMLNINFIETLGILKLLKERNFINETKSYVDRLIKSGFRISKKLYNLVI